ncbi:uncharacterized protein LOC132630443 isoform X1 [Lycium barbarum]|uniref:uncharacterized protein LOC132630443 isoform X1 n=1 Tax=Lycium barbarum TaxID=112863 RepID=UPI00293EB964|nr:uncharacterized protein LOC132630443 isoform X1 [Lycium barbarum]
MDWIPNATNMVELLYNFCHQHQVGLCIKVLDSIPQENAVPDVYKEEAERHLVKATNLNPRLLDAWNCLDGCIAKKGDYHGAKNCFEFVLRMAPNSSVILRQLAQLELQFAPGEFRPLLKLLTLKF